MPLCYLILELILYYLFVLLASFSLSCSLSNLYEVVIDGLKVEIVEKIKKAKGKNKEIVGVVEEMKKAGVKMLQEEEW